MPKKQDLELAEQQLATMTVKSCEIYSRVVGYLRPVNQWNAGKKEERKDRVTYTLK